MTCKPPPTPQTKGPRANHLPRPVSEQSPCQGTGVCHGLQQDPASSLTGRAPGWGQSPASKTEALPGYPLYQVTYVITCNPSAMVFNVKWCCCSSKPRQSCLAAPCSTQLRKTSLFVIRFYTCSSVDLLQH